MKRAGILFVALLLVVALAVTAWLWAYHHRKSNDNLPALASLSGMEEAEVAEILAGYSQTQLAEVWGTPQGTLFGRYGEIWDVPGGYLYVYYTSRGIVETVRLHMEE